MRAGVEGEALGADLGAPGAAGGGRGALGRVGRGAGERRTLPEGQEATAHLNISPLPRHLYLLYEKYVLEEMRNKLTVHWAVQAAPLHGPLQWWLASAQHRLLSFSPSHLSKNTFGWC